LGVTRRSDLTGDRGPDGYALAALTAFDLQFLVLVGQPELYVALALVTLKHRGPRRSVIGGDAVEVGGDRVEPGRGPPLVNRVQAGGSGPAAARRAAWSRSVRRRSSARSSAFTP
jgi:hypothetical protein